MTALLTALGSGISAKKILEYLMRKSPELSPRITKALASGLSAEKIIGFFSKDKNFEKLKSEMEQDYPMQNNANPLVQAQNVRSKNLGSDMASGLHRAAPGILAGAGALGAGMALKHAIPTILQGGPQVSPQTTPAGTQSQTPLIPQTSQPPVNAPTIPQTTPPVQSQVISNPKEYLEKHGILSNVDTMLKRGNTPEAIAASLGLKKGAVKIDPELLSNIEEYAKQKPTELAQKPTEIAEIPQDQEKISPKIEKSSMVASPKGMGEVKEIRNGKALIDIDGKLHKIDEEELIQSPLPEKDLADLHDEYMRGIEEETGEDISRMVNWAGYNPNTNTLAFLPHIGALYTYKNISPEQAKILTSVLTQRKTSGGNFIGPWIAGTKSPIGAAMSTLIKTLQQERGGKGNEYEEKFETIYDALEPGKLAAKKKKKKKK